MKIGVFGAGYVGLVTGACLASLGHSVTFYDRDAAKMDGLRRGLVPFYEPELEALIASARGRIAFGGHPADAVRGMDVIFIAVGTPSAPDGNADLSGVSSAARAIAEAIDGPVVVVNKSTVPVHTAALVEEIVRARNGDAGVHVVSNPEFLREGSAVHDFFHPDRIVLGSNDPEAEAVLRTLYAPLEAPMLVTDRQSAELIKYAANAFLATKVSYVNEIAAICERVGGDIDAVLHGVGLDRRIGSAYFEPGLGFGGSCLPKDVRALQATALRVGAEPTLLDAVLRVNETQIARTCARIAAALGPLPGKRIAVLGLTFKPETDDVRESPAVALALALRAAGAAVTAHDPIGAERARPDLGGAATIFGTPAECVRDADAFVIATAWAEYRALDPARLAASMRRAVAFDLRNALDAEAYTAAGFTYYGVGREPAPPRPAVAERTA